MKRIFAIALVVLMIGALLASCGGGGNAEGKYVPKSIEGQDMDAILSTIGLDSAEDYMTIELKAGGKAVVSVFGEDAEGTWTQSGSTIAVDLDGDTEEFTLSGNELKGEMEGSEIVFVKK